MSEYVLLYHLLKVDKLILRLVAEGYRMGEIAGVLTRTQGELFTATQVRKCKERAAKRLMQSLQDASA